MQNPFVSLIIPVYKVEEYLNECVDSVLNQDFKDIEIILVDDGSPDNCPKICDEYADKFENIKVIHQQNAGLSAARNAGINFAKSEYLMFLDSDDFLNDKVSLSEILCEVKKNKDTEVFIYNSYGYYGDEEYFKRSIFDAFSKVEYENIEQLYKQMAVCGEIFETAYTKILNRDFVINNNLYFKSGLLSEDNEWFMRILRCVKSVKFLDYPLSIYRANREGSITNSISLKNVSDLLKIIRWSVEYYKENPDEFERIGKYEFANCAYLWFIALGMYEKLNNTDKKSIVKEFKELSFICKYSASNKVKLSNFVCKLFGVTLTAKILNIYVSLMKRNIVSSKEKVEV